MKIVCCSNMPYAPEAFSTLGDVAVMDGRAIQREHVRDADLLAIRSITKVNRDLLEGSSVRFVGTGTIGIDHMDTLWLDKAGIKWCHAPGCNANSVSEYIIAALLFLANRHGLALAGKTIGVIGVGNVGSLVAAKAEALGMRVLRNDPPKQRVEYRGQRSEVRGQKSEDRSLRTDDREQWGATHEARSGNHQPSTIPHQPSTSEVFHSLDEVLTESDIVTLHVPMTKEGQDRTYHMADEAFFGKMKRGSIFLNSARGAVVKTDALLGAMARGIVSHAVIDTWEGEPVYRRDLLERTDIGTAHIAGHSFDGKVMGTLMVYREACKFLGIEPTWNPDSLLPPPLVPEIQLDAGGRRDEVVLWDIVRAVYDIEADDRRLRESCVPDDKARAANFDSLRRNYPERREFQFTRVMMKDASPGLAQKVTGLGFRFN